MRMRPRVVWFFVAVAAAAALAILSFRALQPPQISADIIGLPTENTIAGFPRADHPREFQFPQDHGPHPEYQTEWWYYTGNLDSPEGRHFGYQLTFFRRAITSTVPLNAGSDWATNQVYFAHFAITNAGAGTHWTTERFSRGAAGLAGAKGDPYHVWLENWQVRSLSPDGSQVTLSALDGNNAIDLHLTSDKTIVLEGDKGLSLKSSTPGDASYYYSLTHLVTEGLLTVNGTPYSAKGVSWMDHEFGTTELGANTVGWDWFSIQLNDGRELMVYRLRNKDGSVDPLSRGTLVEADGQARQLTPEEASAKVLGTWTSPLTGVTYPSKWELQIPSANLLVTLTPYVGDQENRLSIRYWEGAVAVAGTANGVPVKGSGYVELTGYTK